MKLLKGLFRNLVLEKIYNRNCVGRDEGEYKFSPAIIKDIAEEIKQGQ